MVVHVLAVAGQCPEPGAGVLAVSVRVLPAVSVSDFRAPVVEL